MRTEFAWHVFDKHMDQLIEVFEQSVPEKRNIIPAGFKNHIHWHLGHVLVVTQFHVLSLSEQPLVLPDSYQALFAYGTIPTAWEEEAPAWDTLMAQLKLHREYLKETLKDRLGEPVKENFLKAETIGELIYATSLHLFYHQGVVYGMNNALK
ncbi:DinB family protein [Paenibacillus sp. R14(2021)]|uniref:DinB family protein n=1 Tax=Paenibacillus sp. R14(2021) TaxID=2859228 RepID=UPI001C61261B|nr:DinB family protein [Paenibacillus sp. R14(2021)]